MPAKVILVINDISVVNMVKTALIGYTGFVGGNLSRQHHFDGIFNSSNIGELKNQEYDLIVCAAPSAVKWKANKEPEADLALIRKLMDDLKDARTGYFVHISTIDVYGSPIGADEDTPIETEGLHPYGRHRLLLEGFISDRFERHLIVRLPALFGEGLKKNLIYDLLHDNCLDMTDAESEFQFYNIGRLWEDVTRAMAHEISLLNITSEPISSREVANRCFGRAFENRTNKPPAKYDLRSKHYAVFGGRNGYLYSKETVVAELKDFVGRQR